MPRTIFVRKTWRCPTCDAEWDSDVQDGKVCPYCGTGIVRQENDVTRCGTLTVMGVEDIEPEIEAADQARIQKGRPVQTAGEKATYRAKRQVDIAAAIVAARVREYKP